MPKTIVITSEDQWLELKTKDISSTESSALFNMSPYLTKFELYHLKKSGEVHTISGNERTEWGNELEASIASGISKRFGLTVQPLKCYMRHDTVENMGSSFDFEIIGIEPVKDKPMNKYQKAFCEYGNGVLEIKNVDSLIYKNEWEADEAPAHIEFQVQHQMEVINYGWTMIGALVGGNRLEDILRIRDTGMGAGIVKGINKFWEEFALDVAPQPDWERDAETIIAMYKSGGGSAYKAVDLETFNTLCTRYEEAQKMAKAAEVTKDEVKAKILMLAGDAASAFSDEYKITLSEVKDNPGVQITEEMIGQFMGVRRGYRQFRLSKINKKEVA